MSANEEIVGVVKDMKPTESENPKAPAGTLYVNKLRLTIWDKELWSNLEEGKSYKFIFTSKDNEYNGKTYTNRNVSMVMGAEPLEKSDLELDGLSVLVNNEIKEIEMPEKVIDYLKNVLDY